MYKTHHKYWDERPTSTGWHRISKPSTAGIAVSTPDVQARQTLVFEN